jgi:hypothetical protein
MIAHGLMVVMPVCHSATSASMRNDRIIAQRRGRRGGGHVRTAGDDAGALLKDNRV